MFEEGLFTYLSTHAGLSALVGTKIYPQVIQQDTTLPAVTYNLISKNRRQSTIGGNYGLVSPIYEFRCYATTYSQAKNIGEQIKSALLNYSGAIGSYTVQGCFYVSEFDGYDSETKEFYVSQEFEFYYTE